MIAVGFLLGAALSAPVFLSLGMFAGRDSLELKRAHLRLARRRMR